MKELVYHRQFLPAIERFAGKVGFHDGDWHATYEQHGDRVLRLADSMRRHLGLERHDRFAVLSANCHQYLELFHAGFLGAGLINPLNLRLAGQELQFILADSGTTVVFVDPWFAEHFHRNVSPVRSDLPIHHVVLMGDADVPHDMTMEDLISDGFPVVPPEPEEDDPVVLMYTGGTTGLAKGVLLDQRAEMLNGYHIGLVLGFDERRVYLHQTPMFHAASMGGTLFIPASGGTSVVVPFFDPEPVMAAIETYQVNWTTMVPTMIAMIMDHPQFRPERLASLRDLVYGASPMPRALLERLMAAWPDLGLTQGYGMTESSSVLTLLTADDHRRGGEILRSAGRTVPGAVIEVRDPETDRALPPRTTGEICARAGNLMREYWHRPEQTAEALHDGWYHTGDAGFVDEEGYVFLVDRVKDMIVTGGENVYSTEVENALSTHPAVAQVAVIGIPHDTWGEQVHAVVITRPGAEVTEEDLRTHARQTIAGFKVPKSFEFRSEPFPLSGALKVLKRDLRAPYWAEAAGEHGSPTTA